MQTHTSVIIAFSRSRCSLVSKGAAIDKEGLDLQWAAMRSLRAAIAICCLVWPAAIASGQDDSELTRYFRSIRVEAGQTTSDAMCFMCPIYVRGKIDGGALALGGDIVVEGEITGDAIVLGGRIVLSGSSKVEGDAVAIGGEVPREGRRSARDLKEQRGCSRTWIALTAGESRADSHLPSPCGYLLS